jgi:hypothetical protein
LWSDRPFISVDIEDKFSLLLSINILSVAVLEIFQIFVAKFTVYDRLYVVNNEASCSFSVGFLEIIRVYVFTN